MKKTNILAKAFACIAIAISAASCVSVSSLSANQVREFSPDGNQTEFIETRTAGAQGLTLSEIFAQEKEQHGSNISIVNVVEQTRETKVFFIFSTVEKFYIYDVVRNKQFVQAVQPSTAVAQAPAGKSK
jgi:hypothetical protein